MYEEGYWPEEENRRMKERLEKLIDEAKQEHTRYLLALVTGPMDEDAPRISEAAFIADKLIEAGVCFRLVVPRKEIRNDI